MSEYTPTTGDVEHYYELARDEWNHGEELTGEQYRAEFARWLAAEKTKWQAEAWERGRDDEYAYSVERAQMPTNPYVKGSDDDR